MNEALAVLGGITAGAVLFALSDLWDRRKSRNAQPTKETP